MKISKLILVFGGMVACNSYLTCDVLEDQMRNNLFKMDYKAAQECVDKGADVNALIFNKGWNFENQYRFIHFFTREPMLRARALTFLVKNGVDLNLVTKDGKTAYQLAIEPLNEALTNLLKVCERQYKNAIPAGQIIFKLRVMSFLFLTSCDNGSRLKTKEAFIANLANLKQLWQKGSSNLNKELEKDCEDKASRHEIYYNIVMMITNFQSLEEGKGLIVGSQEFFDNLFLILVLFNRIDGVMLKTKEQRIEHFNYWNEFFSNLSIDS